MKVKRISIRQMLLTHKNHLLTHDETDECDF